MVYFNENDSFAAAWLSKLYPLATIDKRSIRDVAGNETNGFTRCHFFGGIGGWEYALELAGWPEGREVWTGSCPCQPFSAAGKRKGTADERHLWPEFLRLIAERKPATIFGEQVASPLGRAWLAGVRSDLEALGYAIGAADLCAASVGAPHIRQRLFWVADAAGTSRAQQQRKSGNGTRRNPGPQDASECDRSCGLADPHVNGRNQAGGSQPEAGDDGAVGDGRTGGVGRSVDAGLERYAGNGNDGHQPRRIGTIEGRSASETGGAGFWSAYDLIPCRDGKSRRIEPGTFPLAHGVPNRVGRLRGYGNAIVPQVAAEFIAAFLDFSMEN